jgi:putative ABC transport system permease protein
LAIKAFVGRRLEPEAVLARLARTPARRWWQNVLTGLAFAAGGLTVRWAASSFYGEITGFIILLPAVVLAALTAVLGLPLGLALAWALLAVVNVEAFGWRLPMYLFWKDYLRLGGLALVAGTLAAAWPAWRLSGMAPARLLGVFRHER